MISQEQINSWLFNNQWTEAEKKAFLAFVENDESSEVSKMLESTFNNNSDSTIDPCISARMLNRIKVKADIKPKTKIIKFWKPLAAAASVILILLSTLYFYNSSQKVEHLSTFQDHHDKNDITPGGNKATLTLSDGSSIILDSAQNGLLSTQGNAQVTKSENGKLIYQKETNGSVAVQYNTITTPRGGQYQLTLADGSQVWLNANSSITFPTSFTGDKREVSITGEAYFEVSHNAQMPFRVSTNDIEVQVLGTHFNINAYKDEAEIKTTLLEGSVKVTHEQEAKIIAPGQQLILNNVSGKMVIDKNINLEQVMAWKNGKFYFNKANIQSIMKQVSRWYNVDVEYKGEVNKLFEGTISKQVSVADIFKILSATGGVHFEIEGRKIIVSP